MCYASCMNTNQTGGNDPQTIDAYGNIIAKPFGVSRWAHPKKYACKHENCENAATILRTAPVHNCCNQHEEAVE